MENDPVFVRRRRTISPPGAFIASPASVINIAFIAAADGGNNGGTTSSHSFNYTVSGGPDRYLVVAVAGDTTNDLLTGVTYNGVAMTQLIKQGPAPATTANRWTYLYGLAAPASGSNSVALTASGTSFILAGAGDYTGVRAAGQPDTTAAQALDTNINAITTPITTVTDKSWAILVENSFDGNLPPAAFTGVTLRTTDAAFGTWGLFDSGPISPAGLYNLSTTRTNNCDSLLHIAAALRPAT